jgi:hypothetical protein
VWGDSAIDGLALLSIALIRASRARSGLGNERFSSSVLKLMTSIGSSRSIHNNTWLQGWHGENPQGALGSDLQGHLVGSMSRLPR